MWVKKLIYSSQTATLWFSILVACGIFGVTIGFVSINVIFQKWDIHTANKIAFFYLSILLLFIALSLRKVVSFTKILLAKVVTEFLKASNNEHTTK